ncbi:MAG: inorganic phosphate transporter [Burkholderiaceae bacterium]|jgi:PiT family inorganic phosphate transporter|nr:inorganic phosphate transporter [Burkholderiaceae bacterium]MEB2320176.1 inorganic phosphate transporter [Pseudomonadota bacterium]
METAAIGLSTLVLLVALALAFDFLNGFHDAANSIATIVSTRVLKPHHAVVWAASFNFAAVMIFEMHVATTIGKGIVEPSVIDAYTIFGALIGAIVWNLLTWWYGIPSSSSHALVGGLVGATLVAHGPGAVIGSGIGIIVIFILVAPTLGFVIGSVLMLIASRASFRAHPMKADKLFRILQLASSALYSLGHGSNDAQKTMGVIWLILIAGGRPASDPIPFWVIISCYAALSIGTLLGGWRIVRTMGQRLTRLRPIGGCCAETGGAITLFLSSGFGIPVSTTHTITGAIVGVGSTALQKVRWGLARHIVWAWIVTIPAAAAVAAVAWWLGRFIL